MMFNTRRSIRKYKDKQIEKGKIDLIIENTLFSPTSKNRRPWEFIVVKDKERIDSISKVRATGSAFLKGAPCVILVIGDPTTSEVWIEDTSIAAYAIQLAAHEQGLGTCWVQIRLREHDGDLTASDYLKEKFGIPGHMEVACAIGIGYPDEEKAPHELTEELLSKVHYESY
jgi:nitroreductase